MNHPRAQGQWVIVLTVLCALTLSIIPLPTPIEPWRPEWTVLVLIYWSLALPERVCVGVAWVIGLFQDVLVATPLGAHALGFALAAYLTIKLYQRIRNVPVWQQAITVLLVLMLVRATLLLAYGLVGNPIGDWRFWLPAISGTLAWPLVFWLLRFLRRYYQVR